MVSEVCKAVQVTWTKESELRVFVIPQGSYVVRGICKAVLELPGDLES